MKEKEFFKSLKVEKGKEWLKSYLLNFGISVWWWMGAGIMVLCFLSFCFFDWIRFFSSWATEITAAPYKVFVIVRALEFLIPAFALFIIGIYLYLKKDRV